MYIKNVGNFPKEKLFKTNKIIADWLIKVHKFPILSTIGKIYYFNASYDLEIALTQIPFYLKPFLHIPKAFQ